MRKLALSRRAEHGSVRFVGYRRGRHGRSAAASQMRQAAEIRAYAQRQESFLRIGPDLVDEGPSGRPEHAPGAHALLALAESGAIDAVVIAISDWIPCDLAGWLRVVQELQESGVELHDAAYGPMDLVRVALVACYASMNRSRTRERIAAGRAAARRNALQASAAGHRDRGKLDRAAPARADSVSADKECL